MVIFAAVMALLSFSDDPTGRDTQDIEPSWSIFILTEYSGGPGAGLSRDPGEVSFRFSERGPTPARA